MAMSAQEARTANFSEARDGLDASEVNAFREAAADALAGWEQEAEQAADRLKSAEERLAGIEEAEDAVRQTFIAATTTKREMLSEAEAASEEMRSGAVADAARLRVDAERETSELRARTDREINELLVEAQVQAATAEEQTRAEVQRMENRMAQLRTAVRDLDSRLRAFATAATDELAVTAGMIDLETTRLEDIEAFRVPAVEVMPTVDEPEVAVEIEATPRAADAGPSEVESPDVVPAPEAASDEPADEDALFDEPSVDAVPAAQAEVEVEPPAEEEEPATEPVAADEAPAEVPVEPSPPPVEPEPVAVPAPDLPPVVLRGADDEGFYQRRLAGLRRRIESSDSGDGGDA